MTQTGFLTWLYAIHCGLYATVLYSCQVQIKQKVQFRSSHPYILFLYKDS